MRQLDRNWYNTNYENKYLVICEQTHSNPIEKAPKLISKYSEAIGNMSESLNTINNRLDQMEIRFNSTEKERIIQKEKFDPIKNSLMSIVQKFDANQQISESLKAINSRLDQM